MSSAQSSPSHESKTDRESPDPDEVLGVLVISRESLENVVQSGFYRLDIPPVSELVRAGRPHLDTSACETCLVLHPHTDRFKESPWAPRWACPGPFPDNPDCPLETIERQPAHWPVDYVLVQSTLKYARHEFDRPLIYNAQYQLVPSPSRPDDPSIVAFLHKALASQIKRTHGIVSTCHGKIFRSSEGLVYIFTTVEEFEIFISPPGKASFATSHVAICPHIRASCGSGSDGIPPSQDTSLHNFMASALTRAEAPDPAWDPYQPPLTHTGGCSDCLTDFKYVLRPPPRRNGDDNDNRVPVWEGRPSVLITTVKNLGREGLEFDKPEWRAHLRYRPKPGDKGPPKAQHVPASIFELITDSSHLAVGCEARFHEVPW